MNDKAIIQIKEIVTTAFKQGEVGEEEVECIEMLKILNAPKSKIAQGLKIFKDIHGTNTFNN